MWKPLDLAFAVLARYANPRLTELSERQVGEAVGAMLPCRVAPGSHHLDDANRDGTRNFLATPGLSPQDVLVFLVPTARRTVTAGCRKEMRPLPASRPARLDLVADVGLPGSGMLSGQGIIRVVRMLSAISICRARWREISCVNARNLAQMIAGPEGVMPPTRGSRYISAPQKALMALAIPGDVL